jgi:hypothetical protein
MVTPQQDDGYCDRTIQRFRLPSCKGPRSVGARVDLDTAGHRTELDGLAIDGEIEPVAREMQAGDL